MQCFGDLGEQRPWENSWSASQVLIYLIPTQTSLSGQILRSDLFHTSTFWSNSHLDLLSLSIHCLALRSSAHSLLHSYLLKHDFSFFLSTNFWTLSHKHGECWCFGDALPHPPGHSLFFLRRIPMSVEWLPEALYESSETSLLSPHSVLQIHLGSQK